MEVPLSGVVSEKGIGTNMRLVSLENRRFAPATGFPTESEIVTVRVFVGMTVCRR